MAGFPGCSVPDDVEYQRASTTLRGRHRGRDSDWYPRQSAPQGGSERTINRFRAKREFVARGPQGLLSNCSRTSHLYDVAMTQPGEPPDHEHSLSSDLSDPLSTWSRCLALGLGGAAGVAGGFAVFASENQAGTAALLLIAGVLVLKAPIRPLSRWRRTGMARRPCHRAVHPDCFCVTARRGRAITRAIGFRRHQLAP